ncbi:MAG: hypothetical protein ACE5GC_08775 [Acidimicrobiia bacterium]
MTDRRGTVLALTALVVTWTAGWLLLSRTETPPVPEASLSPPTVVVSETAPPTIVHLETPAPQVEGLTAVVSRVLAARGFAESVQPDAISEELPPSVVRLLIERGVALSVAEDAQK